MGRRHRGFSTIELMILLALAAVLAALAVPHFVSAKVSANETNAIAALRSIAAAQMQFQESATVDVDMDGKGEYGGFLELSGQSVGRCAGRKRARPALASAFRLLSPGGEARHCGYHFRIFLPRSDRAGVAEPDAAYDETMIDADLTETTWVCYAWPVDYRHSGGRTFVINQRGQIVGCRNPHYSGESNGPSHNAAFRTPFITSELARDVAGQDGNIWRSLPIASSR